MPELSEVEITRLKIEPLVRGRQILNFWTDWPRGLKTARGMVQTARDMRGREIGRVSRRGKVLFFHLSGKPERKIAVHLRMSGRLIVSDNGDGRSGRFRSSSWLSSSLLKWTHFKWVLSGGKELQFVDPRKFGVVWYGSPADLEADRYVRSLGCDAKDISFEEFAAVLEGGSGAAKAFLLRQDKFCGIGNIIADEMLWRAKIHPQKKVALLDRPAVRRLHGALWETLRAMFEAGGTSLRDWAHPDGGAGTYQKRRLIYGRAGKACLRCRAALERIQVAGRGTTICPKCQRL